MDMAYSGPAAGMDSGFWILDPYRPAAGMDSGLDSGGFQPVWIPVWIFPGFESSGMDSGMDISIPNPHELVPDYTEPASPCLLED